MVENVENKNIKETKNEFKKINELKKEDVKNLDTVPFTVKVNKTKFGTTYRGSIPFGLGHLNFRLDENAVLLIGAIRKMNVIPNEFTVISYVRYVSGIDKNGNDYYQAQVLVGSDCYFTSLIGLREMKLYEYWINNGKMKKINFVKCPAKDVESGLGYFED